MHQDQPQAECTTQQSAFARCMFWGQTGSSARASGVAGVTLSYEEAPERPPAVRATQGQVRHKPLRKCPFFPALPLSPG